MHQIEAGYEVSNVFPSFIFRHLSLPHFDDVVNFVTQELNFFLVAEIHVGSTAMLQSKMCFGSVGIAFTTAMPKATLKFVDGVRSRIVAVHGVTTVEDTVFSIFSNMLNSPTLLTLLPQ